MTRTDLDPATLARMLRRMAGDGSVEWVMEPMQASVLLDIADALDENAKLRELVKEMRVCLEDECKRCHEWGDICDLEQCMRELGMEVG